MKLSPQMEKKISEMGEPFTRIDEDPEFYKKYPEIWEYIYDLAPYSRFAKALSLTCEFGAKAVAEDALELVEALEIIAEQADTHDNPFASQIANEALEKWKQKWESK